MICSLKVLNFLNVMHAVKSGWVGQTFALSKSNEYRGRKSRIRRSKEERKAMVEIFIKKYQKLNNGNFPSLNLTHKEVGGSFYTVREIVRDIIQENRVLGPAKFTQEEQSSHQFEEGPVGSMAIGPQYSLTISNDSQLVTNEHQGGGEEPNLVVDEERIFDKGKFIHCNQIDKENKGLGEPDNGKMHAPGLVEMEQNAVDKYVAEAGIVSGGRYDSPKHEIIDNGIIVNGSLVNVENKESDELTQTKLQMSEPSEANVEEESADARSKVTPIEENIIVETFPMSPVAKTNKMDGSSREIKEMGNGFTEQDANKMELAAGIGSSQMERTSSPEKCSLMDEKDLTKISNGLLNNKSLLIDEKAVEKNEDPLLESSDCCNDVGKHEIQDLANGAVKVSGNNVESVNFEQSQEVAEAKGVSSPNDIKENLIDKSGSTSGQSKAAKERIENEVDVKHDGSPKKESNATFDRINLESWEGASNNSAKPNGNLWAVFKAFIDAFVRFWSE